MKGLTDAQLLRYYMGKDVAIQTDTSQMGLGTALMQEGQPMLCKQSYDGNQTKLHSDRERTGGDSVRM